MLRPSVLGLTLSLSFGVHAADALTFLDLNSLSEVPSILLSSPEPPAALGLDTDQPTPVFAETRSVDITPQSHGYWIYGTDVSKWYIRFESSGAKSINLAFDSFLLPDGARMQLFDGNGRPHFDAFTAPADELWTPLIEGESLLIEISLPTVAIDDLNVHISRVNLGFRTIQSKARSGDCHIASVCPEGDAWTREARATAMITIGGRFQCSATLLNNTRQDGRPLLLTAKHCGVESSSDTPASSVVVYWAYVNSACDLDSSSRAKTQSGARLLAQNTHTDFALLELNSLPPSDALVHYAGWDASGARPVAGAGLHHPLGDAKKISLFSEPAVPTRARIDDFVIESWRVTWSDGTTEPGSSGSALWDRNHRIVGQFSGGRTSCSNTSAFDYYGRIDEAWFAGSGPSERLQPWLDPDNVGALQLEGSDLTSSFTILGAIDDTVNLPANTSTISGIDILSNDWGEGPLQIVSAFAESGIAEIDGNSLVYTFAPEQLTDAVQYEIVDRWGNTTGGTAIINRESEESRAQDSSSENRASEGSGKGGAFPAWFICLGLLLIARNRRAPSN